MAKLTRDTARRSIDELLKNLPANAVIDLTQVGSNPPPALAATVRVDIAVQKPVKKTAKKGPSDAGIQGQPGPDVASGSQRGNRKKSTGTSKR